MIVAHQPGSQPIDVPETIPNPVVPAPVRTAPPERDPDPIERPEVPERV
jgi:hypothetical protein